MDQAAAADVMRMLGEIHELVDDDGFDWSALSAALIGGLLAIFGGVIQSAFAEWRRVNHERTVVRGALLAEIASLVELAEIRDYMEGLEQLRDGKVLGFTVKFQEAVNPVFQANVMHLGLLDPKEARAIIRFHGLVQSLILDMKPGGSIAELTGEEEEGVRREHATEAITILRLILDLGSSLIARSENEKARQ